MKTQEIITPSLTEHAVKQAQRRGVTQEAINITLTYGSCRHTRGAVLFIFGYRDRVRAAKLGVHTDDKVVGVIVICAPNGDILTVYKNRKTKDYREKQKHDKGVKCYLKERQIQHAG